MLAREEEPSDKEDEAFCADDNEEPERGLRRGNDICLSSSTTWTRAVWPEDEEESTEREVIACVVLASLVRRRELAASALRERRSPLSRWR